LSVWLEITILAIIQGIAEFLPISSSGHLVVVADLLKQLNPSEFANDLSFTETSADLNIVLHAGTLLSIIVVYHKKIARLLSEDRRVIPLLIVGTIPAAVIGVVVKELFDEVLQSTLLAGLMFPVTGGLLLWTSRMKPGDLQYTEMTYRSVLVIGCFQAFALLPGISRSGSTICAALFCGQKRDSAATFSFLLAIPVILGATVLELKDIVSGELQPSSVTLLLMGAAISFVVGIVSLIWLTKIIQKGRLHWFACWCIPLGVVVTAWQLYLLAGSAG